MSNEARDIRINEVVTTFSVVYDNLKYGMLEDWSGVEAAKVAAQLTAIVMRENGENMRHNDMKETLYTLQNGLASRVDSAVRLIDSIAGHLLET